jgi:hypothetical protein
MSRPGDFLPWRFRRRGKPADHAILAGHPEDDAMPKPQLLPFPAPFPKSRYSLSPDEVAELRSLYEELPYAAMRAAEALRVDGKTMTADDLLPFWRAENAVAEIIARINEILE